MLKKSFFLFFLVLSCFCGYAQTIDPVLLQEMERRSDDEKIKVIVIMKSQYDRQQLNRRADYFVTRAERRDFVVNELKQFAEASQYDLGRSLDEMERNDMTTAPKIIWMANALYFSATKQAINNLAMRSDIELIGLDEEKQMLFDEEPRPANPVRGVTPNVIQVNADQVWDLGYTGQGVVVALIDTGVNYNHVDLADHLWDGGEDFPHHGWDCCNDDNDPMDDNGHGTACAGILCGDGTAGCQTGMAPDATLMCVKVGNTLTTEMSIVCSGMQWAVEHGADVLSMSLGSYEPSLAERILLRNTCVAVLDAGVVSTAAAGNIGNSQTLLVPNNIGIPAGCPPPYMDPVQEGNPGGLSCVVCVGAVDADDQAAVFTSHGPVTWANTEYGDYPYTPESTTKFGLIRPDVCAPGVEITSLSNEGTTRYTVGSGTSCSTPCVAGCMALMLSKNDNLTPAELCRILEETAVPLAEGKSNIYGYGRVDALAAVNAVYSGILTLESFVVNDEQGNNDGKLNAGETVTLGLSLLNNSDIPLDGVTLELSTESEYVTITNGTTTLPHLDAGQSQTIDDVFAFTLSEDALANQSLRFIVETYANGDSLGYFRLGVMVYGRLLKIDEVTVLNDSNGDGSLEAGETADLHVVLSNVGNEPATAVVGTLSTTYPDITINEVTEIFGTIVANEQAFANFNVTLANTVPDCYMISFTLDLVDDEEDHDEIEFELWRKAVTLSSNPEEGGVLSGGGYFNEGQTCTITASANEGYAFVSWTLNGEAVSYLPTYSFTVTDEAEYVANFQEVSNGVVIGDGTTVSDSDLLPSYSCPFCFLYSLSEQIYTAEELNMAGGEISSVAFFNAGDYQVVDYEIYMVNTTKTEFRNKKDWVAVSENDQVFSGSIELEKGCWTTIYFSTPFIYDGTSNVVLVVDANRDSWGEEDMKCRVSATNSNQAIYAVNERVFDLAHITSITGSLIRGKNQIILGFPNYDYSMTATANPMEGGTVSGGSDLCYYGQYITLTAMPNEGYVFDYWTKDGEVVSCLSTFDVIVTESAEFVANFHEVSNGIAIGEAAFLSYDLPSDSWTHYALSQQIYTAEEMGGAPCEIVSVSFFNAKRPGQEPQNVDCSRYFDIYMVNTNKTAFNNVRDWIPVTEANRVFSDSVDFSSSGWITVYFDKPFAYNGTSNVALIIDDNTNRQTQYFSCRAYGSTNPQAIFILGFNHNFNPHSPMGYRGDLSPRKNQVIFGTQTDTCTHFQTIELSRGWNWWSSYLELSNIDGLGRLENSIGIPNVVIQSKDDGYVKSIRHNGQIVWQGTLSSINNEEMYKIGTKVACTATIVGNITTPSSHPITINKGWNSIGFPCSQNVSVDVALSGFSPKNKDVIKGKNGYAIYSSNGYIGMWRGTLNTLEPGQGYMYGSRSNVPKTLVFQMGEENVTNANITPENNFFQPAEDYADNMTLTAVVELDGKELRSDDYELAAFVGDECRGSVKLMYVEPIDRYIAFLTIFGEQEEELHFRLTDGVASGLSPDLLVYVVDEIMGELDDPIVLHFGPIDVEENTSVNVRVYPNPSKGVFNVEGAGIRRVEVMNAFGQVILSEEVENDNLKINLSGKAAGAYLLRIVTDGDIITRKLVKE